MRVFVPRSGSVSLTKQEIVAHGGQATVYAKDGVAYKIFHDPGAAIPLGKIQELQAITDPKIVVPNALLAKTPMGPPIGVTMAYIPNCFTLCQLFPLAFRRQYGLNNQRVLALVKQLQQRVLAVHRAGICLVDINGLNFLVNEQFEHLYAIDVDSYQTSRHVATAVTPAILDPLVGHVGFSQDSDWFAFAVVSFQLFVGIHPYRGKHPLVRGLTERMRQRLSVFDPSVRVPHSCLSVDIIPTPYRAWYRAVFQDGQRTPPPDGRCTAIAVSRTPYRPPATHIQVQRVGAFGSPIITALAHDNEVLVLTAEALWRGKQRLAIRWCHGKAIGLTEPAAHPVLAERTSPFRLLDLSAHRPLQVDSAVESLAVTQGRIMVKSRGRIIRLRLMELGGLTLAAPVLLATVLPMASRLYEGVVVQDVLGRIHVTLLTGLCGFSGFLRQLDGKRVVDARAVRNVLMVTTVDGQRTDRWVFRFNASQRVYDAHQIADVPVGGLNFDVLDTGVCVSLREPGVLELFLTAHGSSDSAFIRDPAIGDDYALLAAGSKLYAYRDDELLALSLAN